MPAQISAFGIYLTWWLCAFSYLWGFDFNSLWNILTMRKRLGIKFLETTQKSISPCLSCTHLSSLESVDGRAIREVPQSSGWDRQGESCLHVTRLLLHGKGKCQPWIAKCGIWQLHHHQGGRTHTSTKPFQESLPPPHRTCQNSRWSQLQAKLLWIFPI